MARAPEMNYDKTLRGQCAAFEALNEPAYWSRGAVENRRILGDGNVEKCSAMRLSNIASMCLTIREGSSDIHDAVYVVGTLNPSCVKVGMATDPVARLAQLQTGNPERLFLHRVFWMHRPAAAFELEQRAHAFLGKKSNRLVGEWFDCSQVLAHDTIINACRSATLGFLAITPNDGKEIKLERII